MNMCAEAKLEDVNGRVPYSLCLLEEEETEAVLSSALQVCYSDEWKTLLFPVYL